MASSFSTSRVYSSGENIVRSLEPELDTLQTAGTWAKQEENATSNKRSVSHSRNKSSKIAAQKKNARYGKHWAARIFSMICCIVMLSFIAFFLALFYVILKDLRNEKVTAEDGSEIKLLGFWSLLVLSSIAGVSCCSFSWTLTYFDSFEPGMFPPTPLSPVKLRKLTGHSFHMGYSMALLNGLAAAATVVWCLS